MKYIALMIMLASITAAAPALAFELTDQKTGITTSVDHSSLGADISNNALGKLLDNSHVYGFATVDYSHNDRDNLDATRDGATSPQSTSAKQVMFGISYRW